MLRSKSQANHMGLLSTRKLNLTVYIVLLIVIIINVNSLGATESKFWLYLDNSVIDQRVNITDRALDRRANRGSQYVPETVDRKPDTFLIDQIKDTGVTINIVSRLLNAVSVSGTPEQIESARALDFVIYSNPVAAYSDRRFETADLTPAMAKTMSPSVITALDYGPSYTQLSLCQIDSLHDLDYTGEGVFIGMMDTGFNLEHPSLAHVINDGRLIGTYDWINNDSDVQDTLNVQQDHGTATWSVIGSLDEGNMIGAAYGAEFFLAKTEMYYSEVQIEEDYWIAAAESMEVIGVDIISSSLGYIDWYDQSDLDGDTPAITQAADMLAALGVVVVNSAGNERGNSWGTLIAPSDGDSVIAAGGITSQGVLWAGSSPGPSADGRIKPDVCALSVGVLAAAYYSTGYRTYSGTSFSAPIIAGGLALVMEAHPDWDIGTILNNVRLYASNSAMPNNDLGYGIARFYNMYSEEVTNIAGEPIFVAPHPAYDSVVFHFDPPIMEESELIVYTVAGDKVITLDLFPGTEGIDRKSWNGKNFSGDKIASGIYLAYLQGASDYGTIKFAFVK